MNQKLQDEYAALQWHKIWLKEEIKRADKRQDQIKKEMNK